jgi:hypothetical protein
MHFYSGATQLNLVLTANDLKLGGNFVSADTVFNGTMTQSGNSITVTLGTFVSGTVAPAAVGSSTMSWRPSANAKDLAGKSSATTTVTETADQDF